MPDLDHASFRATHATVTCADPRPFVGLVRMAALFYDTHAHLDYPEFQTDFSGVLERASAAGISRIISIGTNAESSQRAIALAQRHPQVYAAVGWHPTNVGEAPEDVRPALREWIQQPKVVAIGEIGLDYYRLPSREPGGSPEADAVYQEKQRRLFHQQLEVAREAKLNFVIHQRAAWRDTLEMLHPFQSDIRGVFHCFSESLEALKTVMEMGYLVSYTGIITFKNGQNARDALAATPRDRFMLETDCPYLAPVPYRGKRCEPAYVKEIAELAAEVVSTSLESLSQETCATAERFFRFGS